MGQGPTRQRPGDGLATLGGPSREPPPEGWAGEKAFGASAKKRRVTPPNAGIQKNGELNRQGRNV